METYSLSLTSAIDGTYVLQNKEGGFFSKGGLKIAKVPVTAKRGISFRLDGHAWRNEGSRNSLKPFKATSEGRP
jgi:hypothetical protein